VIIPRITALRRVVLAAADGSLTGEQRVEFDADLCFLDTRTPDGRELAADGFSHRPLPLPLMSMTTDSHGYMDGPVSHSVGQISSISLDGLTVKGSGSFNSTPEAEQTIALLESEDLYGVSVDPVAQDVELHINAAAEEEMWDSLFEGEDENGEIVIKFSTDDEYLRFTRYEIMGATIVPFAAFGGARITGVRRGDASADAVTAASYASGDTPPPGDGGSGDDGGTATDAQVSEINDAVDEMVAEYPGIDGGITVTIDGEAQEHAFPAAQASAAGTIRLPRTITAAAAAAAPLAPAGFAPVEPPAAWFDYPQDMLEDADRLVSINVEDDGRVWGYVALAGTCHLGYPDRCVQMPESRSNYRYFHLHDVVCEGGDRVRAGSLTFGTSHVDPQIRDVALVRDMYEDSGRVAADICLYRDEYGIAMAGALRSTVTAAEAREIRGAKCSGDWRPAGGHTELIAVLAVNYPGFPITEPTAVVASAGGDLELREWVGVWEPKRSDLTPSARARLARARMTPSTPRDLRRQMEPAGSATE
jgi:hypothetical protein